MKRARDIEKILHWAYRDELPKMGAEHGGFSATAAGFSMVPRHEDFSREPGFPAALGDPHPDALIIAGTVQALSDHEADMDVLGQVEWLAPECAAYIDRRDIVLAAWRIDIAPYVMMHARMGTRPPWQVDGFRAHRVIGRNGKPVVSGTDSNGRWGWCPLDIAPDPREVVNDRAEYVAWWEALNLLAVRLSGMLGSWEPLPPTAPIRPWVTPEVRPKVHRDLRRVA
jgi:hypothetical protein